jgi:hypothetical protein
MMRIPLLLAGVIAVAGCHAPKPEPDPDPIPEPQAQPQATQLREAIQEPLDKAREVEATQAADEAERQKALEDAGAGG